MGSSELALSVTEIKPVMSDIGRAFTAIATILGIVGTLASFS